MRLSAVGKELVSLSRELESYGGTCNLKLSPFCIYIRGVSESKNSSYISAIHEQNEIIIRHPSCANDIRCYPISKYFPPSIKNEKMIAEIAQKTTVSLFDGFSMNLINYGQHMLGKTHLMFGMPSTNSQFDACEGLFGVLMANILQKMDQLSIKEDIKCTLSCWEISHSHSHLKPSTSSATAIKDLLQKYSETRMAENKKKKSQNSQSICAVSVCNWEEICSVWDIAKHNSCNWRSCSVFVIILCSIPK